MKKKILAMLLAGALATGSVAGFSACNGGSSIPKGDKVTGAEWKEYIENTVVRSERGYYFINLINFTLKSSVSTEATVDGTVMYTNFLDPTTGFIKKEEVNLKATTKTSRSETVLWKDDGCYYESLSGSEVEGKRKDDDISSSNQSVSKGYSELRDGNDENYKYWNASYYSNSDFPDWGHDWSAYAAPYEDTSVELWGGFINNWFVKTPFNTSEDATISPSETRSWIAWRARLR